MFKLEEVVKLLGGEYKGKTKKISGLAPFEFAKESELTFAADEKFLKRIAETKAKVVIVPPISGLPSDKEYIYVTKSPRELMPLILKFFKRETKNITDSVEKSSLIGENSKIGPNVYIGHDVKIGKNANIYPNVTILEGVTIGDNITIYPGVTIREFCTIGNNVIIQPGAVIGSDGFGYVKVNGENIKVEQIGVVVIEDNVEIGANCAIDRGTIGNTIIKKGTKFDNLVHIAHNVVIGEQGLITGQVGIAGSTVVGDNVIMGGQSGIIGHLKVGNNVTLAGKGVITSNTSDNETLSGYPAINLQDDLKNKIALKKLPELLKRVKKLETLINKGE